MRGIASSRLTPLAARPGPAHPCSFFICTSGFDALPPVMRESILARLHTILIGEDRDPQCAKIPEPDLRAILEIRRETKPNLPDSWRVEK